MSATKKSAKKKGKKKTKKKAAKGPKKFRALRGKPNSFWLLPDAMGAGVLPADSVSFVVVRFDDKGNLNHVKASYSAGTQVWFRNEGKVDRRLELDHWPFQAPNAAIKVPKRSVVGPFALDPGKPWIGLVTCHGVPDFPPGLGPGDPIFDTDG